MCAECLEEKHAGVVYGLHLGDYDFRYIGKSVNHKARYFNHISQAMKGGGFAVHAWIRKHGAENIQMTIIETFTEGDLDQIDEREIFHIAQARAYYGKNLNMTDGGDGGSGYVRSAETRAKISAVHTGNRYCVGRTYSKDTKAKLSIASTGNTNRLGKKASEEAKARMSPIAKRRAHGQWHTNRNIVKSDCIYCMEGGTND